MFSWVCHLRDSLHGGGGPRVGEVICDGSCDQIKMRDHMDRWVTPPKGVTSLTWGPPPPCKLALSFAIALEGGLKILKVEP